MSIELSENTRFTGDESKDSSPMIEIVCARVNAGRPQVQTYRVAQGTTAADFLRLKELVVESEALAVMGVFSRKIAQPEQYVLQQGDRLELYQPLILSPMDVRRARARAHPVGRLMHRRF
jgi:putative ubiquitin-RnfH superfamily antitoxin RatB of RatAB toxin-antitoxin module